MLADIAPAPPGQVWARAISTLVGVGASLIVVSVLLVAGLAHELRKPIHRNQRVTIRPEGLELYSKIGSSSVHRSLLKKVTRRHGAIAVHVRRRFFIPDQAFRDAEHRRVFEAALRALVDAGSTR